MDFRVEAGVFILADHLPSLVDVATCGSLCIYKRTGSRVVAIEGILNNVEPEHDENDMV